MANFEVFIPAKDADSFNVTLTIAANNWLGALRSGLANIGEGPNSISNIMCDIKEDGSIHVTDPGTSRVFRLKEIPAAGAAPAPTTPAPQPVPAAAAPKPTPVVEDEGAKTQPEMPAVKAPPEPPRAAAPAPAPAPAPEKRAPTEKRPAVAPPKPAEPKPAAAKDVAAARKVTGQFQSAPQPIARKETKEPVAQSIGREKGAPPPFKVEDVLTDIFERMQDLYAGEMTKERIASFLLDTALAYVKSDAGTFYTSDLSGYELEFTAVRGPAAKDIMKSGIKVPVGQGIVGFCAQEGVSLAISDVQKDPRFGKSISEKIGYECRNMICSPLYKDGRLWGALQLINRNGGTSFHPVEVDVINYLAHEGAQLLAAVEE